VLDVGVEAKNHTVSRLRADALAFLAKSARNFASTLDTSALEK